jgi:hypothetical protein
MFWVMLVSCLALSILLPLAAWRARPGWTRVFLWIAAASAIAFPVGVVLHNAVDALLHVEEPVFFLLAVVVAPAGLLLGLAGAAVAAVASGRHPTP